jgi:hypothetical protein
MDTKERATQFFKEDTTAAGVDKLQIQIGYYHGLTEQQAPEWGLYISARIKDFSKPSIFAELGTFVLDNKSKVFMAQVQSVLFSRPPNIQKLVGGISWAPHANNYTLPVTINQTGVDRQCQTRS